MPSNSARYGERWAREELVLALSLYCQIPFAKTKASTPEVARLASILGRTPSSVARKLGNFGAFDPQLAQRGIRGLTHHSRQDEAIWEEFSGRWDALVTETEGILASLGMDRLELAEDEPQPPWAVPAGPTEREATVQVRLCQSFFRRAVLASYDHACCVCGLDLRELLVAGHIVPWSVAAASRTDPQNGLCLCGLHDRAFERGLIAVSTRFQILVSSRVLVAKASFVRTAITDFHGSGLRLPTRFAPKEEYLAWHRANVFVAAR